MTGSAGRLPVAEMTFGDDALAADAAKLVENAGSRLEMSVEIDGYGTGLVAVYAA